MNALSAAAVAAGLAAAATAAGPPYIVQGDRVVGGVLVARSTPADARARFGPPSTTRAVPPYSCVVHWARIGLTINFLDLARSGACTRGIAAVATVASRASWRTALGLRVGDSVARVAKLYPRARLRRDQGRAWSGYWLITRRTCTEVGAVPYPGLLARVRTGRVTAIVVQTAACE